MKMYEFLYWKLYFKFDVVKITTKNLTNGNQGDKNPSFDLKSAEPLPSET